MKLSIIINLYLILEIDSCSLKVIPVKNSGTHSSGNDFTIEENGLQENCNTFPADQIGKYFVLLSLIS